MAYVYVIKSANEPWYYVGSTDDFSQRLAQHNRGEVTSTKSRKPYTLIYSEKYETLREARMREKEIKSRRKIKEEIIRKYGPIV